MPIRKLTKASVETVRPPESGRVEYFDATLPGFALRVTAKGAKSWVVFYRTGGKQVRQTLGKHPVLDLSDAREAARDALRLVDKGIDPRGVKREEEAARAEAEANTYSAVVADFVEKYAKPRQRTWKETERVLKSVPWGKRPVGGITKRDAYRLLDGFVADGQGAKARVTLAWLKVLWRWSWKRDLVEAPVMDAVEIDIETTPRTRHYDDDEIKALWRAADDLGKVEGAFVKLLALLGVRKSELAGMRWDELDDPDRPTLWTVPHERTKTKKSSKRPRTYIVPLPRLAGRILRSLPRQHDELVFPGSRKKDGPMDTGTALMKRVRDASGVEDWYPHAHRDTVATWAQNEGASEYERGLLLNHAGSGSVTGDYSHGYPVELKRQWLERWADHVAGVVQPEGAELLS